jgi:hypothetical protein
MPYIKTNGAALAWANWMHHSGLKESYWSQHPLYKLPPQLRRWSSSRLVTVA